jgi:hypothetical protein
LSIREAEIKKYPNCTFSEALGLELFWGGGVSRVEVVPPVNPKTLFQLGL